MRKTTILLVALIAVSCGPSRLHKIQWVKSNYSNAPIASTTERSAAEGDIFESVFRYQFEHNGSYQGQKANAYFLQLGQNHDDPTDEFMQRFATSNPPVKKGSLWAAENREQITDLESGQRGLVFRIESLKWLDDTTVEATGGYYETGQSSDGNTYLVRYRDGHWIVEKVVTVWVS